MTVESTITPTISVTPASQAVTQVNALLNEFKSIAALPRATPGQMRTATSYLARAVQTALADGSSAVFDALLTFVKDNATGVARADVMLGGLTGVQPSVFTQVSTVYTVLTYLATKEGKAPDTRSVSKLLKGDTRFVVWASLQS